MTQNEAEDTRGFALIVQQEGSAQQTLSRFLNLMLNYQCGLSLRIVNEVEAVSYTHLTLPTTPYV